MVISSYYSLYVLYSFTLFNITFIYNVTLLAQGKRDCSKSTCVHNRCQLYCLKIIFVLQLYVVILLKYISIYLSMSVMKMYIYPDVSAAFKGKSGCLVKYRHKVSTKFLVLDTGGKLI